jgi:Uma2 family endonuclease
MSQRQIALERCARPGKVVPQWILEIFSKTPGGEYGDKFKLYASLGILDST